MTSPLGRGGSFASLRLAGGLIEAKERGCAQIETILGVVPGLLAGFIAYIEPLLGSRDFASAVSAVRRSAESAAWYAVSLTNHLRWLSENGFSREDTRQIRYLTEVLHTEEPAYALIAALTLRSVNGHQPWCYTKPSASRFLADWPGYRAKVDSEIWVTVQTAEYERAILAVCDEVWELSGSPPSLAIAGRNSEMIVALADCLGSSCEAAVLACALRRMFIRAETAGRRAS